MSDPGASAAAWQRQGREAVLGGDVAAATDFARCAVAVEPDVPTRRAELGQLLVWSGAYDEAARLASDLIANAPHTDLGERLMLDLLRMQGRTDEMVAHWRTLDDRRRARLRDHPLGRRGYRFLDHERGVLHRIGETATQLDTLVKMRLLGWREPGADTLLAPESAVANQTYLECWRAYIQIIQDAERIVQLLPLASALRVHADFFALPDGNIVAKDQAFAAVQREWEAQGRGPLLTLSPRDRVRGDKTLRAAGVPEDAWFVCVHVREPGYLRPHEAAMHAFRDADILDARPAMAKIVEHGGWVIRLGDPTMKPLPEMANVIDYAHSPLKSDWMDVYLLSQCRFMLGTTAGPSAVAATFGVPIVMTNLVPQPFRAFSKNDIFLPKLYRAPREHRYLGFREAMEPPLRWLWNGNLLAERGLEAVASASDDILDAVVEMIERLDGELVYSTAEDAAQARYDALFTHPADYWVKSRVGRRFLAKHADLL